MEGCESLDSEMTELLEFQCDASEAISQDDEDEVEELQNSLREVVQDQSIKPKLQCLMVDPSFSMVTVQSEDSGIVWETASSRCSTPWASDTSSVSEAYSMEGSGGAGKITIVFDEDKVVRRRTRSGGRSSRLGDRLSRPGSSRSASALGVERPEMMEISLPNVKQEKTESEPDLEEIKNKDQQLFSLISDGYEILNIRVPSKLPTVDEEESTELQDNLSYLDQTPNIKSRNHHDWTQQHNHVLPEEEGIQDHHESSKQDSSQPPEPGQTPSQKENTGDIDYFEKFTLLDEAVPGEQAPEQQEEAERPVVKPQVEEHKTAKDTAIDSLAASEESFVFVTDVEIAGEHLDEVFYGGAAPDDALQRRDDDDEEELGARRRRESQRSGKENGSVLFGSEETILTPIYISSGPPKIIDPILLEEPTAMSFMYSDLYEDAVGERKRSDEEQSEAESVASEKSYKRCLSDAEEEEGYLEKFTLKDETSTMEVQEEPEPDKDEGRMMWSQSRFEMTGCLMRVAKEENKEKTKTEEPKTQDVSVGDTEKLQSSSFEEKREIVTETEKVKEDMQLSLVPEEQVVKAAPEETVQESNRTEAQEIKQDVKGDKPEPPKRSTDEPTPEIQEEDKKVEKTESVCEGHQCVAPKVAEKTSEVLVKATEDIMVKQPLNSEVPKMDIKSEIQTESTEKSLSEEPAPDSKMVAAEEKVETEAKPEVRVEVSEAETVRLEMFPPTEPPGETETPAEISLCEENRAVHVVPEVPVSPVEVITDQDCAVHAVVEVTEKAVNEKEIQTQVQIDLQEVKSADVTTAAAEGINKDEAVTSEAAAETQLLELTAETAQEPEIKTEITSEVAEPMMPEDVKTDSDKEHSEIPESLQHQQEEPVPDGEPDITMAATEVKAKTPTEDVRSVVQDVVAAGNELILLVPKGQAIEMDIDIRTPSETLPEPDSTFEHLVVPEDTPAPVDVEKTELQEPEVAVKLEELPSKDLNKEYIPPAPVEEVITEERKMEEDLKEDEGVFSPLRSFTPREDLSGLQRKDMPSQEADAGQKMEMHKVEDVPEEIIVKEDVVPDVGLQREDVGQKIERGEVMAEAPDVPGDDFDYEGVFSPLRSFTPREDLSGLQREDMPSQEADAGQRMEMHKVEDVPEEIIVKEDVVPDVGLQREDVGQKIEQDEVMAEAPDVPGDDFDYEMISKQDAEEMPEAETQRYAVESKPESVQDREERVDTEVEMQTEVEAFDLSPEEEHIEDDYEIIDAEEENQARLAAELQGMDWFCLTCGSLLSEDDYVSEEHHSHAVTDVDKAYEEIKEKLSDWISELQGRSENIEDLVSEVELAYNSVEDQCVENEAAMQEQNEEMMALVMEQYNNMSINMEEDKKSKLEQLYDQIVSFQESIDTAKATLDTTAREEETEARSPEDIHASLKAALDSAMSLELGPKGLLVFEDYAKGNTSGSHLTQRKGIPVPQSPTLQPQEPGTATSTSVTVYWKVNPGDIIDCFQVYCMEDPQGAVSEEYRVTVKESYCVLEELEPDKTYKVWVMAVNYTGCSLPSERLAFTTAPSVPAIDTQRCTVMWDAATLRWKEQTPGQSYTLEYCRQYELEGEGLRSISGISSCEQRVLLQPNENYLFYIKAVNEAGASEQSEAALISTKGTRFHLLGASAHPALELSQDRTTLHYSQDTYENTSLTEKQCPSILGELLPARGHYYWETVVSGSTAYRLGVAYSAANRGGSLGENSLSWCLQCVPTPTGCRYQLLHNDLQSSVFVMEMPERVGTLLDYQLGRLSFYNAQSGQLLGSFSQRFTQPCHPALALEMPGSLEISMVLEVPEFTKDS